MRSVGVFAGVWLLASQAQAGTIGIAITQRAELVAGELRVAVELRNEGDEAAHSVAPILRLEGREVRGAAQAVLAPSQQLETSLAIAAEGLHEGRWPFQVAVDYTDANQYPFQTILVAMLPVGDPPPAKVAVPELSSPSLSERGDLQFTVKNLSAAERRVGVRVFAPEAIEVEAVPELSLSAWGQESLAADLTNRAALAGSRYPLYVAVEYEDGDVHQALLAQTTVEIVASETLGPGGRYLWIGAGALGLVFVGLIVFRFLRR
jgi:hypothetical protein